MKPIAMQKGDLNKVTIVVELDFARENITPDWSLTAWAPDGAVTVRHTKNLKSGSFPYIEKDESFDFSSWAPAPIVEEESTSEPSDTTEVSAEVDDAEAFESSEAPEGVSELDWSVFEMTNKLRSDPLYFVDYLEDRLQYFKGKLLWLPGKNGLRTMEGEAAVNDAIDFLKTIEPVAELEWRSGMASACEDHVKDIGSKGRTGHQGTDGSSPYARMDRYGKWQYTAAENLSYG